MYTYTEIFIGIPLSQTDVVDDSPLTQFLATIASEESYPDIECEDCLEDYSLTEDDLPTLRPLLQWFDENHDAFIELGVRFQRDYHGNSDNPLIFGIYINDLFPIHDYGADVVDFSKLPEIFALKEKIGNIFATLPDEVVEAAPILKHFNIWFNNHSS